MNAIDSRAVPTSTREGADIVLAVAAGTNIFKSILFLVFHDLSEIIGALLAVKTFIVHAGRLAMATLQAGNGASD